MPSSVGKSNNLYFYQQLTVTDKKESKLYYCYYYYFILFVLKIYYIIKHKIFLHQKKYYKISRNFYGSQKIVVDEDIKM